MAATGYEISPRQVTNNGVKRQYRVEEALTEAELTTWLDANIPNVVAGFPFADFSAEEIDEDEPGRWNVECNWGVPQNPGSGGPELNTIDYKFNFNAPGGHVYQSLATIAGYADSYFDDIPPAPHGPAIFKGAINVVRDGGKYRCEGFNLSPPNEVFTLAYKVPNSVITGAYQLLVESLCGKVNSTTFRGRPAGSVILARATGGRDESGTWHIEFGFGYVANAVDIPVGDDIEVEAKDGWDLLWVHYTTDAWPGQTRYTERPRYVFIERIFERANLNLLNLPP